ncbi:MAG TPA: zinc-binding dehydrogenase [Verrucomicrobiae bacterium]|nr:zinc-binding dehydrogenase [Verrucomicrobiae bacterium]
MKMTSVVITAPRVATLRKEPRDTVPPRGVRVRLQGCGVCGSNLPVWDGRPWFRYPLAPGTPGHEGWGIVEAVGEEVSKVKSGDRVAMLSYHAFAECDVSPADHVVLLPKSLDNEPFPGEALGCAMNVFARCDLQPKQTVAVVGLGFLGALLVGLARNAGAHVIALGRRASAREMARRMGAHDIIATDDYRRAVNEVKEVTRGLGCERVIEATGFQEPLDLASEICRERGRLIIAGYHQDGPRQVNMQSWNWRGLDVINAHERDPEIYLEGMRAAIDAIAEGRLNPGPLYTHRFRLDQIAAALDLLRDRPAGFMKALMIHE